MHRTFLLVAALWALILAPARGLPFERARGEDARIQNLEQEVATLKERLRGVEAENLRLKEKAVRTLALYTRADRKLKAIRDDSGGLRAVQREYRKLKQVQKELQAVVKEVEQLTGKRGALRAQVLSKESSLKWFLAGAGVFFLGIVVGRFSVKAARKYRSSLEI